MTTEELYNDVRAMGFDRLCRNGERAGEEIFVSAVNRAQETLCTLFPLYEELTLQTGELEARMKSNIMKAEAGEKVSRTSGNARSYSFNLRGKGKVTIFKNGVPFASYQAESPHAYRTVIDEFPENASFRITLEAADSLLEVTTLRVYKESSAAREKLANTYIYRLQHLMSGALALDAPPLNDAGVPLREGSDYRTENGRLYLSDKIEGNVKLTLRRAPKRFAMDEKAPDVRADCAHLLPLLTASYVWLDDDREKSLFYLAMYRELLTRTLENGRTDGVCGGYGTSNGW